MVKQYIIKFMNGLVHVVNTSNETSARYIALAIHPNLDIVSVETAS